MNLKSLLVLFLLTTLAACNSGSAEFSFDSGSFTTTSPSAEVLVEIDRFIEVQAEVNGIQGNFLLDTGAESFAVSSGFAERAGLEDRGGAVITTIAGSSEVEVKRINSFKLGNVVGVQIDASVIDFGGFDGVIGAPFFENVIVSIDYQNQSLKLSDPNLMDLEMFAQMEGLNEDTEIFEMDSFALSNAMINGQSLSRIYIDTGNAGGLVIASDQDDIALDADTASVETTVSATNGVLSGTAFIADSLQIGGFDLEDQFIVLLDVGDNSAARVNLLGNLVMKQFVVAFDLSRQEALFSRQTSLRFGLASL